MSLVRFAALPWVSDEPWPAKWCDRHPETLVLSTDTGFDYDYAEDRYAEYRASTRLFMPGSVTMLRGDQTLAPTRLYWFAWYTFHPGTDLIH